MAVFVQLCYVLGNCILLARAGVAGGEAEVPGCAFAAEDGLGGLGGVEAGVWDEGVAGGGDGGGVGEDFYGGHSF